MLKKGDKVRIYETNTHTECCYGEGEILRVLTRKKSKAYKLLHKGQVLVLDERFWSLEKCKS